MNDWKAAFCGQDNPYKLSKLKKNLEDFRAVWSPEDSLLDVGCNVGNIYKELGRPEKYFGIDLNADLISKARADYGDKFEVGDLYELDKSADVVLCSRVLMHLPDLEPAIRKLRSAARKHCVLFIPVSTEDSCDIELRSDGLFSYFRAFSEKTLREQGDCVIHEHQPYSTVIYGPNLP